MKRAGVLLVVILALAWYGSKVAPLSPDPSRSAVAAPPKEPPKPLSPAEKKVQQERMFGAKTIADAKRAVQASLKDPGSAQFKDVYANYTEEFDLVACGLVNAKNGFGGYTGYKRFVSSGQRVIMEGRDDLAGAWAGACRR